MVNSSLLILILQALVGLPYSQSTRFSIVQDASRYHPSLVIMACGDSGASGLVKFFNRVGGIDRNVTLEDAVSIDGRELTIEVKPENEGEYYCRIGDQVSNRIVLVGEFRIYIHPGYHV